MASKLQLVAEFGRQKTVELSSVRGHWQQYLKTASRIYKYPFWDQLLIHAQRPDATACASMDIWNRRMGRWINRGANGIALIDNNSPTPKVRYVFDISDTHSASGAEPIAIPGFWLMSSVHEASVLEHLSNRYGPPSYSAAPFVEQVQEICANVTDDNLGNYLEQLQQAKQDSFLEELDELNLHIRFRDLVSNSVAYAVLTRCGYDADRLYSPDDFAAIHDFSTYEVMAILGDATSTLSKMMLTDIGRTITSLERGSKFAKAPDMVYDEHVKNTPSTERKELEHHGRTDIHEDRGLLLSGFGIFSGGRERPAPGQVRDAAHDLDAGTQFSQVWPDAAGRRAVPVPAGNRPASPRDGGSDRPADGGSRGRERGDEGQRSDALGGPDEQLQGIGGRNRPAPVGLRMTDPEPGNAQLGFFEQLDTFPQAEYVEPTSSAFFVAEKQLDVVLTVGGNDPHLRMLVALEYMKGKSTAEIAKRLPTLYRGSNGFNLDGAEISVWFDEQCIHIARGKTARFAPSRQVIAWETAAERIGRLLENGQFATNVELAEAPGYERSLLAEKLWYLHHDFSEEARAAGYLPSLAKNPAHGFPEETAWLAEQLDSPEFRQSLTEEYAALQTAYQQDRNLLRFHHHKLQEISHHLHDLSLPRTAFSSAMTEIPSLQQFITDDEIDAAISSGSSMAGGKSRIFAFFQKNHIEKETADFLKQEYGIGGRSNALSGAGSSWESYDGKGLHYKKDGCPDVHFTWEQVAKRIAGLIQKGRYLTGEEQAEYDKIQAEKTLGEAEDHSFAAQVMRDAEAIAREEESYERFSVIETEGGYAVWDDIRDEIYVDEAGISEEFSSEWQANDYLQEVKKAVAEKESVEWQYVEQFRQQAETEVRNPQPSIQPKRSPAVTLSNVLYPEQAERHDYHITDDALGVGTPSQRYQNNIAAIRLLKQLEREDRLAAPEEQEVLARYVGWGGLADCFDERHSRYLELKSLLTPEEYQAARESTLTAFYTPPVVIRSMYQALEQMGFETGNILEPSCGTGNFLGMIPERMSTSKRYGIELDEISGRIAQQLYQTASVTISGYEKTDLPDSFFDVAIGNIPFGNFKVADRRYNKQNFLIHDYFFGKTLDKVRPGGIVAFITSKGTLDKENPTVRKYIAQRADLLGAIRLPNNTFKGAAGTEVTSDILFLQKRDSLIDIEPDWVHLGVSETGLKMNQYFLDHPEMILGEMQEISGPHGPETACIPFADRELSDLLTAAIGSIGGSIQEYAREDSEELGEDHSIPADPTVRNFSYTIADGTVYYRENSIMKPVEVSTTALGRIKGLIGLRDCVRQLIEYQTEDYPEHFITGEQQKLSNLYDAFVKKYGRIFQRANNSAFHDDSSYFLLTSLEVTDSDGNFVRKADMFTKRTIKQKLHITHIDTASEALALSLAEKAKIDIPYMTSLTGKDESTLVEELHGVIFQLPGMEDAESHPIYVTADEYLSGNVRQKLRQAEQAAEADSRFRVNAEALKAVQPVDLTASEISVRLGATWLPTGDVARFMFELFDTPNYARFHIKVHYSKLTGSWNVEGKSYDRGNVKANSAYGTKRISGYHIIEETLNLKDVRIFDYVEDAEGRKTAVLNKKETAIAQAKQQLIKQAFADWIWKDPERRERLCKLYNETFNSVRPREYDGSHLNFVGINPEITLRPHQVNAIAHILYGGNTLLAHVVGAGKTFEIVAAAQESKRLGLCNKSLIAVPNHLTEQWATEYLQLYPAANILVATKKDFEPKNRKRFCGRIATGDYDAIIIGHSQLEKIPMSLERQRAILEEQLREVLDGISDLKQSRGDNFSIKQMERTRKALQAKLDKLNDQSRKDDVVTFEELGVDRLFVDEAHSYKNCAKRCA